MSTGFSEAQAESLTMSLVEIITSSVLNVTDSTVSKIDQVCNWLERFINAKVNKLTIDLHNLFNLWIKLCSLKGVETSLIYLAPPTVFLQ